MNNASKSKTDKYGYPDFIITSTKYPDVVIVVECKATTKKHKNLNNNTDIKAIKDFAVEGVLHYAKFLSKSYHVVAIAFSGQNIDEAVIDLFLHSKGARDHKYFVNKKGKKISSLLEKGELLSFEELADLASYDKDVYNQRHKDLMSFASELHNFMRDYAKLTEQEKPLLVSGTLLTLQNKAFNKSFSEYSVEELPKEWFSVIEKEINKAEIPQAKKTNMLQPYSSIQVHPELGCAKPKYPKGILYELIKMLNENVFPYIKYLIDYDVVGNFYGEFLKYTGGDKKGLGIVLTPRHITELFSLLANIDKDDIVLDPCVGTGGFLISAMKHMLLHCKTKEEEEKVKKYNLIGIEQQPNMFALAASNMILRGDGKANLYQANCFDEDIIQNIKKFKCTVGMINPPYAQKGESLSELDFIYNMLKMLDKNATAIAIIPMSCVLQPSLLKKKLLKDHTLVSVMSMPENLFYPVGTVTVIVVFKAHIPHEKTNKETWFGYWKDDGHTLLRHQGRVNINFNEVKEKWISTYRNKKEIPGYSVMKYVNADDEWCAEAYMETDYSTLTDDDFIKTMKNYVAFKFLNNVD